MIEQGALDEVRDACSAAASTRNLPSGRVLGAPGICASLRGEIGLDEADRARACTATRQFAKRQRTWFRNRMPDWQRLDRPSPRRSSRTLIHEFVLYQ